MTVMSLILPYPVCVIFHYPCKTGCRQYYVFYFGCLSCSCHGYMCISVNCDYMCVLYRYDRALCIYEPEHHHGNIGGTGKGEKKQFLKLVAK